MRLPLFLSLLPFLLTQVTPPSGDPPVSDPPAPTPDPEPEDVSGLKSALEKERAKRKQYEADLKAARDAQAELDRLKADAKKREDDEAAEQGKYRELLEQRDADLATVTTERDSLQERLDTALKAINDSLAATWKDVPEEVRDLYDGADDDALAKQTFLAKPATQKLIERLTAAESPRGNGPNPKAGDGKRDLKAAEAQARPRYRA